MTYLLEIDNLGKRYDDFELSGVSLAVEPGCVVGFIGSNGAGKTTTITVSYTHLAVYTSQGHHYAVSAEESSTVHRRRGGRRDRASSLVCKRARVVTPPATRAGRISATPRPGKIALRGLSPSCLLYTSRCV